MDFGNITAMASSIVVAIGLLAFIVSVIVQVLKAVPFLKNIPNELIVIVLSIALSVAGVIAYCSIYKMDMVWYFIVAAIICGFIVSFVAMFGWEKLKDIYDKFNKKDENK